LDAADRLAFGKVKIDSAHFAAYFFPQLGAGVKAPRLLKPFVTP
jgi:hypothetical protein